MAKKVIKMVSDEFGFGSMVQDLKLKPKKEERNLEQELFRKDNRQEIVDNYEKQVLGIKPRARKVNLLFKSRMFNLTYEDDNKLFMTLMNDPRYAIVSIDKSFTVQGEFLAFIIYSEDQDYKETKKSNDDE